MTGMLTVDDPIPAVPDVPGASADPAVPGAPAVPKAPADPETPAEPANPEKPAKPADPEAPMTSAPSAPAAGPGVSSTPVVAADTGGFGLPVVGVLLLVALGVGIVVGLLLRRVAPRGSAGPDRAGDAAVGAGAGHPAAGDAAWSQARAAWAQERARADGLAAALVDVGDRVDNPALATRVAAALEQAGWVAIDPTGAPFDPDSQQAVDREATGDPSLHHTVATTERLGYRDPSGTVWRAPEVVVRDYRGPTGGSSA